MAFEVENNFKRINFFEGFFTTEEDWNAAETYHLSKRRLHNSVFHSPGVVPNLRGGLRVSSRGKGDLSFEVSPGFAIDGSGNDIVLRDPALKMVDIEKLKLPQTVYIGIKYYDEPSDFIAYKENPRFKGHRRIEEKSKIEVLSREPDGREILELGRIRLEEGVKEIKDASDPLNPGPGEIDISYVPIAGVAGAHISPLLRLTLKNVLAEKNDLYSFLTQQKIVGARFLRTLVLDALMLLSCNQISAANLIETLSGIIDLERELLEEIEKEHPNIAARKGFVDFRNVIQAVTKIVRDKKGDQESADSFIRLLQNCNQSLVTMVKEPTKKAGPADTKAAGSKKKRSGCPAAKSAAIFGPAAEPTRPIVIMVPKTAPMA